MDISQLEMLVLGALLHDIGKFCQRAGRGKSANLEGEYCPVSKQTGVSSHQHVLYTDHFIENDLPLPPEIEARRGELARLASVHHKAAAVLSEKCLEVADRLSAGTDVSIGTEIRPGVGVES